MRSKRLVLTTTILAALIAVAGLSTATWADDAALPVPRQLNFSSVGLAPGQTLRINVSNLGDEPLAVEFFAFDPDAVTLLPAVREILEPGRTRWVDLPAEVVGMAAGRQQIRGAIKVQSRQGTVPDDAVSASLEIYDARTFRTIIAIAPVQIHTIN